jgi:predicted DNA-binding protein
MYTYIVDRTQIYLTPEESSALERASIKTGKTKSQLIREAIDEKYRVRPSLEEFLAVLNAAAGIWANPEGDAAVKAIHTGRRAEARRTRQRMRAMQAVPADGEARGLDDAARR